jgi:hypothetical protein
VGITSVTAHNRFHRDLLAGRHLDLFLVSAICALLLIRFYLHLAGYPTIGGSRLHIAHMLWGGLLMLAALFILLIYLGEDSRRYAAILGGVGFGTFIDEVGKFITHDNDYFFRPGVAIIYVVFVLIYLSTRSLLRRGASHEEYLVNALQEVGKATAGNLDPAGRDRALDLLAQGRGDDPLVAGIRDLLRQNDPVEFVVPGRMTRWRLGFITGYRRLSVTPKFILGLQLFFTAQLAMKFMYFGVIWLGQPNSRGILYRLQNPWSVTSAGPAYLDSLLLGASLLQALFVGLGLIKLRKSRLDSFRMFQRSILVSIFFVQAFLFYRDQWLALIGLVFNVLVFASLRFMVSHERNWTRKPG